MERWAKPNPARWGAYGEADRSRLCRDKKAGSFNDSILGPLPSGGGFSFGMTPEEICEKAGIRLSTLASIEDGRYNSGIREIDAIAKALGATIDIHI